jgi:hypothetical protein
MNDTATALRDFKPVNELRYNKHPKRKNNDLVAAMYAMYSTPGEDGRLRSIGAVAKVYRRTRQAVYDVFRSRAYKLRSKRLDGLQILDGIRFTKTKGGYLRGTFNDRRILMHTYVWEKRNGTVPKGYGIHHIDLNRENNAIENLEMLTIEEISSKHNPHYNQFTSPQRLAA